jgi:spermidine/putrescine transport system substrate-binding protein
MTEKMIGGDWAATLNWNGSSLAIRESRPTVAYGHPKEGYILWMDSVMLLKSAKNVDEAYAFLNFIMEPEIAGIMSNFYRSNNGITGSDALMNPDLTKAPEVVVPEEHRVSGQFMPACSE